MTMGGTKPASSPTTLLPAWVRIWHLVNLLIITPDFLFITLRPHSLTGGRLAFLFPAFNLYATKDALFFDTSDLTTRCIYVVCGLDVLVVFYLVLAGARTRRRPSYALLCMAREVSVATKTAVYLMYSYYFIVPSWRVGTTIMNGTWVWIPLLVCLAIGSRISKALETFGKEKAESNFRRYIDTVKELKELRSL